MRYEKRKKKLVAVLAILLILAIPMSYIRVLAASSQLKLGYHGQIRDRAGGLLYGDSCLVPELVGNLVGGNGMIANSLVKKYANELAYNKFSPLLGYDDMSSQPTKIMNTTLLGNAALQEIAALFGTYDGAAFAYNYVTGEVLVALSLPSSISPNATGDGSYVNRCLNSRYIPGSTMKIVASATALSQNPKFENFTFTCNGKKELADGSKVTCGSSHGKLTLKDAIGKSCNCYMAAMIEQFDVEESQQLLRQMGIAQTGSEEKAVVGKLNRVTSRTVFSSTKKFTDVWSLIGQGETEMTLVDMCQIVGAIANNGSAATPHIVSSITYGSKTILQESSKQVNLLQKETAEQLKRIWTEATNKHYRSGSKNMDKLINMAKTGTAQQGDGTCDRFLLAAMEGNIALMVAVEGLPAGNPLANTIANKMAEVIHRETTETACLGVSVKGDLPLEYIALLSERYNNSQPGVRETFDHFSNNQLLLVQNADYDETAHYNPRIYDIGQVGVYLNADDDLTNPLGPGSVFFHELGHMIDHASTRFTSYVSNNEGFKTALLQDGQAIVEGYENATGSQKYAFYKCMQSKTAAAASDLLYPATEGKLCGKYGHEETYWTPGRLEREAFANFFEVSMGGSDEQLNLITTLYPASFSVFLTMIDTINQAF